jgi:hypothetical protein
MATARFAFVPVFVDCAHDRGQDTRARLPRVPPKPRVVLELVVILFEVEKIHSWLSGECCSCSGGSGGGSCFCACARSCFFFFFFLVWGKGGKCVMHRSAVRRRVWDSSAACRWV